jgi:hypothetical protein
MGLVVVRIGFLCACIVLHSGSHTIHYLAPVLVAQIVLTIYYNTAFHHEIAQIPNPPEYIFFHCERPAETGGQTPLIDSTKVYRFQFRTIMPTFYSN